MTLGMELLALATFQTVLLNLSLLTVNRQQDRGETWHSFGKVKGLPLSVKVGSFWLPFRGSASQMRDALHHEEEWATKFVWGAENTGTK